MTRESLIEDGFEGFVSIRQLKSDGCEVIPRQMGVYVLLREKAEPPDFLPASTGGHSERRGDPSVPEHVLRAKWVNGAVVVYIGKAGATSPSRTLQKRLREYVDFGRGKPARHWGGRLIWQLADCNELLVAWKIVDKEPRRTEREMIGDFVLLHGTNPFANLRS